MKPPWRWLSVPPIVIALAVWAFAALYSNGFPLYVTATQSIHPTQARARQHEQQRNVRDTEFVKSFVSLASIASSEVLRVAEMFTMRNTDERHSDHSHSVPVTANSATETQYANSPLNSMLSPSEPSSRLGTNASDGQPIVPDFGSESTNPQGDFDEGGIVLSATLTDPPTRGSTARKSSTTRPRSNIILNGTSHGFRYKLSNLVFDPATDIIWGNVTTNIGGVNLPPSTRRRIAAALPRGTPAAMSTELSAVTTVSETATLGDTDTNARVTREIVADGDTDAGVPLEFSLPRLPRLNVGNEIILSLLNTVVTAQCDWSYAFRWFPWIPRGSGWVRLTVTLSSVNASFARSRPSLRPPAPALRLTHADVSERGSGSALEFLRANAGAIAGAAAGRARSMAPILTGVRGGATAASLVTAAALGGSGGDAAGAGRGSSYTQYLPQGVELKRLEVTVRKVKVRVGRSWLSWLYNLLAKWFHTKIRRTVQKAVTKAADNAVGKGVSLDSLIGLR